MKQLTRSSGAMVTPKEKPLEPKLEGRRTGVPCGTTDRSLAGNPYLRNVL